ncbi:hypothetical protein [Kitasatospora sp. NPDC093102]|uniref:hypothetical protein n=1 Tax=Kitasatospora sp. NPDC093102 TaxID=3155069 RepID=UPI003426237A
MDEFAFRPTHAAPPDGMSSWATPDPRPALAGAWGVLAHYRALLEDLATGALDLESFRERTRGLRIGLVVDGEASSAEAIRRASRTAVSPSHSLSPSHSPSHSLSPGGSRPP